MKVYCQKCGAKIEFSVKDKPKFCHGCGFSLSLGANRGTPVKSDSEEEDDISQVPAISELDFDLEIHTMPSETLGGLVGTSKGYSPNDFPQQEALSKEDFKKQFQQEAGTLRPSGNPVQTDEEK